MMTATNNGTETVSIHLWAEVMAVPISELEIGPGESHNFTTMIHGVLRLGQMMDEITGASEDWGGQVNHVFLPVGESAKGNITNLIYTSS